MTALVDVYIEELRLAIEFDGFVKYDTNTGDSETHGYGDGRFGGETVFAPRVGATAADDDGYVLTFVTDAATGAERSQSAGRARLAPARPKPPPR